MQQPLVPANETARLRALVSSALLDTAAEPRFDRVTNLVQQCLGTEIVLISLVDNDRQWFKSRQGLSACETGRDISFCGHAILSDAIFQIPDASTDPRFTDNPLVTSAPFIRFYAGAPLHYKGERIGTLCIIDPKSRQLSPSEQQILRQFADVVEQEIADRLQEHSHQQLAASELMSRSVLEGTRIGTWQWNVQSGETVFNERWAEIVGYTLDELAPIDINTWLGLAHPDDLADSGELLAQHFAGQLPFYDCKCRMKHKNGDWVWVHDRGRVVSWTEDNKPLMMYGTHADITAIKQDYLELERLNKEYQLSQQRLELASETALIGFWQASLITGELWWSPVIYKIFGFDENTTPSVALFKSTLHPDDRALVAASEQRSLESGLHDVVHRIIRPDGSIRWVHELAKLLPQDENPEQILVGSVQDVTEQMQLQQMKDAFISNVSHELRTPLTAIKGALGLLNSGKLGQLPPTMQKLMHVAKSNSERLAQLINDLLDIEKLAAGKMPFDIQSLVVSDELQQAVDNLQPFAGQHQITLEVQPLKANLVVQADSLRLQQVLTNLVANAVKFSAPDTKVKLSVELQGEHVWFNITDCGSGIPVEFHDQIFQRFAQADDSNQRQTGGTGLGLAICKELVQNMGGSIGFNSTPGKGATFYFALPAKPDTMC
tara:strand:+ start:130 stop:2118 length:1989 start_codon:yes stop_codon:yes gene_type:complete